MKKFSSPLTERDLRNRASSPSRANTDIENFTKDSEVGRDLGNRASLILVFYKRSDWFAILDYLTIIPRARIGSESIAHEAEGRMGY